MIVPVRLALLLTLLWGTAARADAAPSQTKRERPVQVTVSPAGPLPEIHVAQDVPTVILFPAAIQRKTLTVDPARIRVLDAGERSIIVQAVGDYRTEERQQLEVFFADGKAPARAAFVLVMDADEVDTRVDVKRPELLDAACAAGAPRVPLTATDAVVAGLIDQGGVSTAEMTAFIDAANGFRASNGVTYRADQWVLVDMAIRPPPSYPAWRPRGATLTSKTGEARVRLVKVEPPEDASKGGVRVLVEADVPPPSAGLEFTLYLKGPEGTPSLSIPTVKLPPATQAKEPPR